MRKIGEIKYKPDRRLNMYQSEKQPEIKPGSKCIRELEEVPYTQRTEAR